MSLRRVGLLAGLVLLVAGLSWGLRDGPRPPFSPASPPPASVGASPGLEDPSGPLEADWDELGRWILDLEQGHGRKEVPAGARRASAFLTPLLARYQAWLEGSASGNLETEEEALAYEYLFGTPQRASRSLEALGRTLCLWRVERLWPGARRQPPPLPLPAWGCCPVDGKPYQAAEDVLRCGFHDQSFSLRQPIPANSPSELYPQLTMGYFRKDRSRSLDAALEPSLPAGVQPGEVVVDYGCGVGFYTWSMAHRTGSEGRVLAVDIDPGVLDFISFVAARRGLGQVRTVLATRDSPNLKRSSLDRIFLIDVYNVLAGIDLLSSGRPGPRAVSTMQRLVNALRSGGRLVLIDFIPQPGLPHVSEEQAVRDMGDLGLTLVDKRPAPAHGMYVLTFEKP